MNMNNLLSVWLVPQKDDENYLSKIIQDLDKEYNAPIFTPHLTLFGNISIELDKLKSTIDDVFDKVKPFEIQKTRINQSEAFFKTVFIEFELNNILKNLFTAFSEKTDKRDLSTFKPHVSLIYKTMPEDEKLKIIEKLEVKDKYVINRVFINAPKIGDTDHHDVESWRTLYKKTLI